MAYEPGVRSLWSVRRRGTGCRVGVLHMVLGTSRLVVETASPPHYEPPGVFAAALWPARMEFEVDHEAGVVWVDRAADLHGLPGFELDA